MTIILFPLYNWEITLNCRLKPENAVASQSTTKILPLSTADIVPRNAVVSQSTTKILQVVEAILDLISLNKFSCSTTILIKHALHCLSLVHKPLEYFESLVWLAQSCSSLRTFQSRIFLWGNNFSLCVRISFTYQKTIGSIMVILKGDLFSFRQHVRTTKTTAKTKGNKTRLACESYCALLHALYSGATKT